MTIEDNHKLRIQKLEVRDEKRLLAQQLIELYQVQTSKAFNKKMKERVFKQGDLVLAMRCPMIMTHKSMGKFKLKWEGLFVI